MSSGSADITGLLKRFSRGDQEAQDELMPLVYEQLRAQARRYMRKERSGVTMQSTALVHETYLKLVHANDVDWHDRSHFFALAAQIMRRILIDAARRKSSRKRGGGMERQDIEDVDLAQMVPDEQVLLINEALEKLEQEDPNRARIVVLKFFGGLTNREVGETMGIGERSVEREWAAAKVRIFQWIRGPQ